jgi:hypothetical protein
MFRIASKNVSILTDLWNLPQASLKIFRGRKMRRKDEGLKGDERSSMSSGKHLHEEMKGFIRLLKLDECLDLKEVKSGIGFGVKLYPKPFMDSPGEVVS